MTRLYVPRYRLTESSSGSAISSYALTSGVAIYSTGIDVEDNIGFASLLVVENKSGGAGDVDISAEYSFDNSNWYTFYDTDMAGTLTAEGNLVTTLQNVTRWIEFEVRMAKYIRFKFDPDADSQITADFFYQNQQ